LKIVYLLSDTALMWCATVVRGDVSGDINRAVFCPISTYCSCCWRRASVCSFDSGRGSRGKASML